jgi:hypothetical protein
LASFEQHVADSKNWLGDGYEAVHLWLDEYFKTLGPLHRRKRHHQEGVDQIRSLYGPLAAMAAAIHILRDCRHIPKASHYDIGFVDQLGLRKSWPTSAYVRFPEEDFAVLVKMNLEGPTGIVLWSFLNKDSALGLLSGGMVRLTPEEVSEYMKRWNVALSSRESLSPLRPHELRVTPLPSSTDSYLEEILKSPLFQSVKAQHPEVRLGFVPIQQLICPLVFVDNEYLEELRAELQGNETSDFVRFALPKNLAAALQVVSADPSLRTVTLVSPQKTLTVGPVQLQNVANGLEVKFTVAAAPSLISVSQVGNRLILRNGIHRAFLLAQLGAVEVPCIITTDVQLPLNFSSAYPSFHPNTFFQARPPLLADLLDASLSTELPLQTTRKLIRISAEESIIPVG